MKISSRLLFYTSHFNPLKKGSKIALNSRSSRVRFAAHIEAVLVAQRWALLHAALLVSRLVAQAESSIVSDRQDPIVGVAVPMTLTLRRT